LLERYPGAKVSTEGAPYYPTEQETIEYLRGYDAAIVSFEPIDDRVLGALPELKVISKLGVGSAPSRSSRSAWRSRAAPRGCAQRGDAPWRAAAVCRSPADSRSKIVETTAPRGSG
jgi:hypothetical protein